MKCKRDDFIMRYINKIDYKKINDFHFDFICPFLKFFFEIVYNIRQLLRKLGNCSSLISMDFNLEICY